MEQEPQPQRQEQAQILFKKRAHVQKALMLLAGVEAWFKGDSISPVSLAERFSDYCDNPGNAAKCLATNLDDGTEVNKLLEVVRAYKKGETLH